ncbi:terminase large subunit domain-containing protein [Rhodospirillum centenum]|uniref:Terminase large subunit n=1 Tax=Rhodospirillum centenum (strain ATCC 51521 / SW) TaxID=414684 RepID=B6IME9_RHOCS|nr:terminase family protein [Rhodospirillum centenum]ACI98528.1 terminase large subunit [Rhodospirillum centenum SW]
MSDQAAPFVLLPYQQRWIADRSPVKAAEKSRRVGLTWAEAADDVLIAGLAADDGGDDVWYIGYNQDMAREFIETCADWARHFATAAEAMEEVLVDDEDKDILAFRIRFASGHKITALSSRPSNLRGKQGVVVIDEAAFHPDLKELLKAAFALLIWGGRVRIISTHDGVENAFNELCEDIRAGRNKYSLHRITFDEALSEGLYRRICLVRGVEWSPEIEAEWRQEIIDFYGDGADEELFCIPKASGGRYIPRALIEARMDEVVPVLRWVQADDFVDQPDHIREADCREWLDLTVRPHLLRLSGTERTFFGEDFGRSGDLTVIWPLVLEQNLVRRTPFIIEMRNIPFRQQEQVLFYLVDRLPRFSGGKLDARGNGQYLAEVARQRYGSQLIEQVMLSEGWYRDNMPRLKAAFEDGTITLPKDADVLDDFRAIEVVRGVARVPDSARTKGRNGQRHGDAAIAAALAYAASEDDAGPIDATVAGDVRHGYRGFAEDGGEAGQPTDRGFGTLGGLNDFEGFM